MKKWKTYPNTQSINYFKRGKGQLVVHILPFRYGEFLLKRVRNRNFTILYLLLPLSKCFIFQLMQSERKLRKTITRISGTNTVKTRPHVGATTVDICDYIKLELCYKPDVIIIHCETYYIENEMNKVKKIKKLVKEIDEYDKQNPPKVISSLVKRYNQDLNDDIANINEKLQRSCDSKGLSLIDNNNIDRSCLNALHLNRRGSPYLANNF